MRSIIATAFFSVIFAAVSIPVAAQNTGPVFLFSLEGKGVPTGTIHVYNVNTSTGAISEVPASPFNAGLIPWHLVVDPTGRFIYVVNLQSNDITALSVDAATGALTPLPGSPFPIGAQPVTSAVDPTGRFLYVFATNIINSVNQEFLYEYAIDSATGVLTPASSSPTTWEFVPGMLFDSIAFSPAGNFAYIGQGAGGNLGAPTMICSVDFSTGNLTVVGALQPNGGQANQLVVSPQGNFLFSVDTPFDEADAFSIVSGGASLAEVPGSPYAVPNIPYALTVHPSGKFLYIVNENQLFQTNLQPSQYNGNISEFTIDPGSGALAPIPGSPIPAGINPTSIVTEPTGRFAYSTATTYTTGFTSFAQIEGFSVDAISGALTPLAWSPWTDSAQFSNGNQLVISAGQSNTLIPTPMISSLSPPSTIATGVAFTLQVQGSNFVSGSTVYFGGQPRATTFISATQLDASILAGDVDNGGTAVVFVFNPLPGGGASTSVEFPVSAPVPQISSLSPTSATAGGIAFTMAVLGSNFVTSSIVLFNGTPLQTNYSGPTVITAVVAAAQIASAGTAGISVTSPANGVPGGGTSNTVTLSILLPNTQPVVSNISPTSAAEGGPGFTLTVNGGGFVPGSQISFNLINVATTFVSATQLTSFISASAIAIASNNYVIVTNPDGFASTALNFAVNNPQPVGGSVSAGSNALTLNVSGTGFTQSSVVLVGGSPRNTVFLTATLLQATLLPGDLSQGGTLVITIVNPPPGGGTSSAISFTMPSFSLAGPVSPQAITAGQTANFALILSSSNGTYPSPVTLSVSGLPAGTTASFSPSATITPVAAPSTNMLSIATSPHVLALGNPVFRQTGRPRAFTVSILAALGFFLVGAWLCASGKRARRLIPQLLLGYLLATGAALVGCGAVGSGTAPSVSSPTPSPSQPNPTTGTPAGTYTIRVNATSSNANVSTTVTLTVM